VVTRLQQAGHRAFAVQLDVTQPGAATNAWPAAEAALGQPIDASSTTQE